MIHNHGQDYYHSDPLDNRDNAMCLILFAINRHPHFKLVVAANRDEFFQRPTTAMHWWPDRNILAGQDQMSGGTWLAITPEGTVSAVTNVREGRPADGRSSRGELPLRALTEPEAHLAASLSRDSERYAGFNLIHLTTDSGWHFSNRDTHPGRYLHRGLYGLSNHLLQSPWPKLVRARQTLHQRLANTDNDADTLHRQLLSALQDPTPAPDDSLPDTGVDLATERFLSSPFIAGDDYGTRASTIVTVDHQGVIQVTEQNWEPGAKTGQRQHFQWQRDSGRAGD